MAPRRRRNATPAPHAPDVRGSGAAEKPIDLGSGRTCASFDLRSAAWLSIGTTHDAHGFVELNALPAFDERERGDPTATRRHRRSMTLAEHAFLSVEVDGARPPRRRGARRGSSRMGGRRDPGRGEDGA